jgi:hypothetical protein
MLFSKEERAAVREGRLSLDEARRLLWRRAGVMVLGLALGIVFGYGLLWALSHWR